MGLLSPLLRAEAGEGQGERLASQHQVRPGLWEARLHCCSPTGPRTVSLHTASSFCSSESLTSGAAQEGKGDPRHWAWHPSKASSGLKLTRSFQEPRPPLPPPFYLASGHVPHCPLEKPDRTCHGLPQDPTWAHSWPDPLPPSLTHMRTPRCMSMKEPDGEDHREPLS